MKDGWIKVACGTPRLRVADTEYNAGEIIALAHEAAAQGVALLALPELAVTGYTCGDLFLQQKLMEGAHSALKRIGQETAHLNMLLIVGIPFLHRGRLYNCAAVFQKGKLLALVPKTYLPNYGEFQEKRWFTSAPAQCELVELFGNSVMFGAKTVFACENCPDLVVGVEICEDLWAAEPPSVAMAQAGATVLVNLSASNELAGKQHTRRARVAGQSARLCGGYLYANAGPDESTTDLVFGGHSLICEYGELLAEKRSFSEERLLISELDVQRLQLVRRQMQLFPETLPQTAIPFTIPLVTTALTRTIAQSPFLPQDAQECDALCEEMLLIQSYGLRKRLAHAGAQTAVVGISGGLDSALALLVAVRAADLLGWERKRVLAVTMPCFGTTARTKNNAELLCERLAVQLHTIDIRGAVERHFDDIGHDAAQHDATFENAQARERTQVLMDLANQTNGLVVGTGDLSELALGWATYNGDHMSMYGVNAGVPKTVVRALTAYAAAKTADPALADALRDILDTPVSPELLPPDRETIAQKTEDLVGPYELHDFFLYYILRWGFAPGKVLRMAEHAFAGEYDRAVILGWLRIFYRRFFSQQFKRSCLPDGPKVGPVSLSPRGDWRMPSDASSALWMQEVDAL